MPSNEKSISLALEIAKRARSKKNVGPDEVRKARLHNILFDSGSVDSVDTDTEVDLSPPDEELDSPKEEVQPTRKDRLARILSSFPSKQDK